MKLVNTYWSYSVPDREFVLVSSPMSGMPGLNLGAIRRVCESLGRTGIVAYNPFMHETEEHLRTLDKTVFHTKYIPVVTHERCMGVVVLPGWEGSSGAVTEVLLAGRFGKPLFEYVEEGDVAHLRFYERSPITL